MRDPVNLITPVIDGEETTVIKFNHVPLFDIPDYNLSDDKEYTKYIKDIKYTIRKSFEYQEFVQFLRMNLDMHKCSIYTNISNISSPHIKIHVHHDPFTIEDIICIVVAKRQKTMEPLDVELVAEEVMRLHYQLKVGLIPLAETVHQLVHNSYIFIPTTAVMGRYREFVNYYSQFDAIPDDLLNTLEKIEEYSINFDASKNLEVLSKHYIYVDPDGDMNPSSDEVIDMMKDIVRKEYQKNDTI